VWLADGSTFESSEGKPDDVPKHPRLICIAQRTKAHRWCLTNGDFYFYRTDLRCWMEHTDMGALMEMVDHAPRVSAVRAGKYIKRADFQAMFADAREWAGLK
jgi:hypothetical protein